MKMTFRWYGPSDSIPIESIAQIPAVEGVVSAVYGVPVGEVWSEEAILTLKNTANANGLTFEVVESVPVHEEIKLGAPSRDRLIANYCENIRRLAKHGVKCICYNFMPVFDWLRSEMARELDDGSNALAYDEETVLALNPLKTTLSLPGWDESYTHEEMVGLLNAYKAMLDGGSGGVVNNYYNNDNSRTVNQTNNSPKSLSRLEIYRQTRNALNV